MTMFLTRVVVPKSYVVSSRLKDRYAWHQKIWKAFPDVPKGTKGLFQWRIDHKEKESILWILSTKQPDFQKWKGKEKNDFQDLPIGETKEVGESFLRRRRYVFSLCANPTVMKTSVDKKEGTIKKNGRRVGIYHNDKLIQWLQRKGETAGFSLEQVRASSPVREYFSKGLGKDRGVHSVVEFTGILNVVDQEIFSAVYKTGIGSAKGFGFGLLLLKPIE